MSKRRGRPKASAPMHAERQPKAESPRSTAHQPRRPKGQQPRSTAHSQPVFGFAHVDTNCDPGWAFAPDGDDARLILDFLREMSKLTWAEIESMRAGGRPKHHSQEVETFNPRAQRDFRRARLGEKFGDEMFRFRLSGERRLWGFRDERTFYLVWWDNEHKVYPTEPN